jgi:3-oxoadipate enol-lactonase
MSFASINGTVLHYRLSGAAQGAPLVLVNSLGTNLHIWDDVVASLSAEFRILCYDMRGHGLSDAPPGPYSIDDHVGDLLGLATHCGFDTFDYCGISIGGMIGIRIAAHHSHRLRRVMLCDTGATIGNAAMWNERITQVEQGGMAAVADAIMARWVAPDFAARHPERYAGWRNMVERCPPAGYAACCASIRDADLTADLARIAAPTMVVVGEHDIPTPPDVARGLADAITGAVLRRISNAGHVPAIEQPDALATLIREHLSEVVHV